MRLRIVPLVAALVIAALAAAASAGQVLELRSGDLVAGRVVSLDDRGVTFQPEKGGEMHVAWERVTTYCRFDLWEASLAPDDAAGRVALARWALEADLHRPARRALLEAQGLGYGGPDDVAKLLVEVRRREADDVLEDADSRVAAGDLDGALDRVRTFLRVADPGPDADRVRSRVPDLLQRIEKRDEAAREAEDARKKAEKDGRLQDWIRRTLQSAEDRKSKAGAAATEGFTNLAKGNQTRARDGLGRAESLYLAARTEYGRVRKSVKQGPVAEDCAERVRECDERVLEVLIRWARLEVDNKAWKKADAVVDRGLRVDPVQPELLELRQTIDRNWIRRKVSEVTNASGTTSPY